MRHKISRRLAHSLLFGPDLIRLLNAQKDSELFQFQLKVQRCHLAETQQQQEADRASRKAEFEAATVQQLHSELDQQIVLMPCLVVSSYFCFGVVGELLMLGP